MAEIHKTKELVFIIMILNLWLSNTTFFLTQHCLCHLLCQSIPVFSEEVKYLPNSWLSGDGGGGMWKTKQIDCKKYHELWNKTFPKVPETSALICPLDNLSQCQAHIYLFCCTRDFWKCKQIAQSLTGCT